MTAKQRARAIRDARQAARLTQEQLAARIGVKASGIGRWERGQATPRKRNRRALIAAIRERHPSAGDQLAAALQGPPAATQPAPSAVVPPPPDPATLLQLAVFRMADELDLPPRRLRGPLLRLLTRLRRAELNIDDTRAFIEQWMREVE